ncbi:neuronal calcium sensor 1 isoform X3 [Ahaetulla prasina]|uniref:neuronal calcium sensor 1 isoform X3 n=1 Tax=Ahaetulla prasina TaxID=499056 RepID=UPI00264712B9|nr:neuronal calcium sensor 1 isoform X3 [Ahaetulla prasina]
MRVEAEPNRQPGLAQPASHPPTRPFQGAGEGGSPPSFPPSLLPFLPSLPSSRRPPPTQAQLPGNPPLADPRRSGFCNWRPQVRSRIDRSRGAQKKPIRRRRRQKTDAPLKTPRKTPKEGLVSAAVVCRNLSGLQRIPPTVFPILCRSPLPTPAARGGGIARETERVRFGGPSGPSPPGLCPPPGKLPI